MSDSEQPDDAGMPADGAVSCPVALVSGDMPADGGDSRPDSVDWLRFITDARLGPDEIAHIVAGRIQAIPQRDIAAALGWTHARAERVRRRVDRRLARLRTCEHPRVVIHREPEPEADLGGGSSLNPFYWERLDSGHRVGALSHSFLSMCPQVPIYSGPVIPRRGDFTMGTKVDFELASKLAAGRARASELDAEVRELETVVRSLASDFNAVTAEATAEAETAVIERRKADSRILGAPESIEAKLKASKARLETARGAALRARGIVDDLQNREAAQRQQAALELARPVLAEIHESLGRLRSQVLRFNSACNHELTVFDFTQSDPKMAFDLEIIRAVNSQMADASRCYQSWREAVYVKEAA
jgi:outer membrane murein-binding lipoprotein Lpp